MTRKHYAAIAHALATQMRAAQTIEAECVIWTVARALADTFELDNPRFDRARFYAAAGVPA